MHTVGDSAQRSAARLRRAGRSLIGFVVVLTLLFTLAVWLDLTPWLRGPDEWRWTLRSIESPIRLLLPVLALGLYVIVCARWLSALDDPRTPAKPALSEAEGSPTQGGGAAERRFLWFVILAAPLIQLALAASVSRYPLLEFFGPTVSELNSGYFSTAIATPDLHNLLTRYPSMMSSLPVHVQSHPPGPIVAHWLGWRFFESVPALADAVAMPLRTLQCHNMGLMTLGNPQIASAAIGMVIPLIGAFAIWPMVAFGKSVVGSRAAVYAAALFPVVPLFAMWSAQWDQVYPLLLFIGLYFTHTGLERRSAWRLLAAGVSLSIATFFSVGNFVLMAIVGLYGFVWTIVNHKGAGTRRSLAAYASLWWRSAIAFGLGCASIWLIYAVLYRVNPLDVISTGSRLAYESTTGSRSYGVWVIRNPIDFAMFFGAPMAILLVAGVAKSLRGARSLTAARHANSSMLLLIVATVVPLAALNISGAVRGEVGRLWMYFGPLLALIVCAQIDAHDRWARAVLIGLMALQLLTLYAHWRVNDSFLDQPPERRVNFLAPQPQFPRRASFGKTIELVGYDVSRTGRALNLALYWHALVQPAHAYTVFVHVLDETGRLVAQQDNMPVRDQLPTSCWQPGEFVVDPYSIPLPASVQGPLSIEIGLYRLDTAERLGLDDGSGTSVTLTVR